MKKKRFNIKEKQENLSIPEFLQDKNKEKKEEFNFLSILDNKIEALKFFGNQKENDKSKNFLILFLKFFRKLCFF